MLTCILTFRVRINNLIHSDKTRLMCFIITTTTTTIIFLLWNISILIIRWFKIVCCMCVETSFLTFKWFINLAHLLLIAHEGCSVETICVLVVFLSLLHRRVRQPLRALLFSFMDYVRARNHAYDVHIHLLPHAYL